MDLLVPALGSLLVSAPIYLLLLTGIVLAVLKWRSHPLAARLAFAGLGLMLVISIVGTTAMSTLPLYLSESGVATADMSGALMTVGVVRSVLAAVAWGLIIAATFLGRSTAPK